MKYKVTTPLAPPEQDRPEFEIDPSLNLLRYSAPVSDVLASLTSPRPTIDEVAETVDAYFAEYPGVKEFMESLKNKNQ